MEHLEFLLIRILKSANCRETAEKDTVMFSVLEIPVQVLHVVTDKINYKEL